MGGFDFDEWADLYRRDPAAFEARRQTMLALELAKAPPAIAAPARATLNRLEERVAGRADAERVRLAIAFLADAMADLHGSLHQLLATATSQTRPPAR